MESIEELSPLHTDPGASPPPARHALGQEQERVDALELGQAGRADDGRLDRALRADVARRHARLLLEECASPAHRQSKQHTK